MLFQFFLKCESINVGHKTIGFKCQQALDNYHGDLRECASHKIKVYRNILESENNVQLEKNDLCCVRHNILDCFNLLQVGTLFSLECTGKLHISRLHCI